MALTTGRDDRVRPCGTTTPACGHDHEPSALRRQAGAVLAAETVTATGSAAKGSTSSVDCGSAERTHSSRNELMATPRLRKRSSRAAQSRRREWRDCPTTGPYRDR